MNMIRKGQVEGVGKRRCHGTSLLHPPNLWSFCLKNDGLSRAAVLSQFVATEPV